jgi:hypothetical protein
MRSSGRTTAGRARSCTGCGPCSSWPPESSPRTMDGARGRGEELNVLRAHHHAKRRGGDVFAFTRDRDGVKFAHRDDDVERALATLKESPGARVLNHPGSSKARGDHAIGWRPVAHVGLCRRKHELANGLRKRPQRDITTRTGERPQQPTSIPLSTARCAVMISESAALRAAPAASRSHPRAHPRGARAARPTSPARPSPHQPMRSTAQAARMGRRSRRDRAG